MTKATMMRVMTRGMSSLPYTAVYCACAVETTHGYTGKKVQSEVWPIIACISCNIWHQAIGP
eukprot:5285040-Prorocentrum_lima.AAC.1